MLDLDVRADIDGTEVYSSHTGVIEGETFNEDANFRQAVIHYLDAPIGANEYLKEHLYKPGTNPQNPRTYQDILDELGYPHLFRVVAYMESKYNHFETLNDTPKLRALSESLGYPSPEVVYPTISKQGSSTFTSDGGYGLFQLTVINKKVFLSTGGYKYISDKAAYKELYPEIWNWQENIYRGIYELELRRSFAWNMLKSYLMIDLQYTLDQTNEIMQNELSKTDYRTETYNLWGPTDYTVQSNGKRYLEWNKELEVWQRRYGTEIYADEVLSLESQGPGQGKW